MRQSPSARSYGCVSWKLHSARSKSQRSTLHVRAALRAVLSQPSPRLGVGAMAVGGIWALVTLEYFFEEGQKGSPFTIRQLKPIQMPNMDMGELREARTHFEQLEALVPEPFHAALRRYCAIRRRFRPYRRGCRPPA